MTTIPIRLWNALVEDEKKVAATFSKAVNGVEVALHEVEAGIGWIEDNAGTIISKIQFVEGLVAQLAIAANPNVAGIVLAANAAVASLNAAVAARQAGVTTPQQLIDAYQAFAAADAAVAQAKAAAALTPSVKAAP